MGGRRRLLKGTWTWNSGVWPIRLDRASCAWVARIEGLGHHSVHCHFSDSSRRSWSSSLESQGGDQVWSPELSSPDPVENIAIIGRGSALAGL